MYEQRRLLVFILILSATAISMGYAMPAVQRDPAARASLIREEKTITVSGAAELWRLQWKAPPTLACPPVKDISFTCPCEPFAYAETGELDLVRLRKGEEVERLELGPFFDVFNADQAVVQRWPRQPNDQKNLQSHATDEEWQKSESARIQKRPVAQILKFADYNHDGTATEFYLPTTSLPCGKNAGMVIGVTKYDSRLRPLGTVASPDTPLVLKQWEWDALKSSVNPTVLDWKCGDNGAREEIDVEIQAIRGGLTVAEHYYQCPRVGRGYLIRSVYR